MTAGWNLGGWKRRLLRNRILRSAGLLAGAAVIGQALMLAVMPLLTRLYDPADFGIFAVFSASMGMVLVVSSLRYELAIPLMRNDGSARGVLVGALFINGLTAGVALVAILVWRHDFGRLLNAPEVANYLLLLPLGLLGAGSYRALNLWALRKHRFRVVAQTKLTQSVTNVAMQIVGGVAGLGPVGLIVGHILGFTAGVFRLSRDVGPRRRAGPRRTEALLRSQARFPKFDVPAALVDFLGSQLPNLALAAMFSPAIAGIYFLAERVLTAPMSIVSQAIGQSVLAGARQTIAQGKLLRQTLAIVIGLAFAVTLPAAVVMVAGEYLFSHIFDETWRQSGLYAAWLVPGFAIHFIYSSISTTLTAIQGQKLNLAIHSCLLALKAVALWAGYQTGDPLQTIIFLAMANIIGGTSAIVVVLGHIAWGAGRQVNGPKYAGRSKVL